MTACYRLSLLFFAFSSADFTLIAFLRVKLFYLPFTFEWLLAAYRLSPSARKGRQLFRRHVIYYQPSQIFFDIIHPLFLHVLHHYEGLRAPPGVHLRGYFEPKFFPHYRLCNYPANVEKKILYPTKEDHYPFSKLGSLVTLLQFSSLSSSPHSSSPPALVFFRVPSAVKYASISSQLAIVIPFLFSSGTNIVKNQQCPTREKRNSRKIQAYIYILRRYSIKFRQIVMNSSKDKRDK